MMEKYGGEMLAVVIPLAYILLVLAIAGVLADYVLPNLPPVRRYLDSLPWRSEETDDYISEENAE